MNIGEQIIHFGSVEAGRIEVIAVRLQFCKQVRQGDRLPVAGGFVEHDIERLFVIRILDVHYDTHDLLSALCLQHLEALMPSNDISCHFVPYDRVDIPEVIHGTLDLFIRRIAWLQVFSGIVFCRFQF